MGEYLTREKLLGVSNHKHFPIIVVLVIIFLFADLVFLNYKILNSSQGSSQKTNVQEGSDQNSTQGSIASKSEDNCGVNCIDQINKAVSSAISSGKPVAQVAAPQSSSVKEYFVPFGTGMSSATTWTNVSGLEANIDSGAYGQIKTITFEASSHIPTGSETVSLRLYNSTANHPVWYSELDFSSGSTVQLMISPSITLDPGSNLYIVQAQTQLGYPASIDQARVHVITY